MQKVIPVILVLLANELSGPAQPTNETFRLRATVTDVRRLDDGKPIIDPARAITVRIESISPPLANYTNGSYMAIVFPKPARPVMDESCKGQKYDLVVSREVHGDARGPWHLDSATPARQPDGAANRSQPVRPRTNHPPAAAGPGR